MRVRSWIPAAALAVWTLVVWVGRVRLVFELDELSGLARAGRLALAASFLALGAAALVGALRARQGRVEAWAASAVGLLALWSLVHWGVRGVLILGREYSVGFKAVHSVLALASIGLALWALRSQRAAAAASSGRLPR
ncbi:MAG: hypothetical protein ACKVWR_10245 [Acidimicrobiales bacterium]